LQHWGEPVARNRHAANAAAQLTAKRFLRKKEYTMGDKGGKKDKDKGQKQKVSKKEQDQKKKQDKRPKRP
jgi:hypothetical protein